MIDEVEFFSRVLSGGEINTIFTSDVGGKCKPSDLTITKTHAGSFLQNSTGNTYTITVHNDGPSATSGLVTMQDMLPSGLTATGLSGTNWTCTPIGGGIAGPATLTCTRSDALASGASYEPITLTVTVTNANESLANTATVSGGGEMDTSDDTASDQTAVINAPVISKSFSPTSIPQGGTSSLMFTINNPNTLTTLNGVAFSDTLPAGLSVADSSTSTCSGTLTITAATRTISLSGASIANSGSCMFNVPVGGTTAGDYTNTTGNVSSSNGGTGNFATANLSVVSAPGFSKSFSPTTIAQGATSTLTFTITNTNATATLTGVGFSDTLPVGLDVANSSTPTCSGTLTTTAATRNISLAGASVAPGVPCTFNVTVTGTTAGVYTNTTGTVTSSNGGTGPTASAGITVVGGPMISKSFSPTTILVGSTSTLTFTITNSNTTTTLTGVGFSDQLPVGLSIADSAIMACSGTLTTTAATRTILLSGATVAPGVPCTFNVTVTGSTEGNYTNTTGNVTSTNGGTGNTASANLAVVSAPSIAKAFNPTSIPQGSTSTLTFTITNPNTTTTLTGVGFSDVLPAGLSVADSATPRCSGTLTTTAATRTISLSGASVAPGVPCTFNVTVTGTTPGSYNNTTGNVTSNNGGTGNTASASVTVWEVNHPPTANNDTLSSVAEDSGPRTILASTLTANDSPGPANESGQTLIIKTVSNPVGGTVSIVGGNVVFTPTHDYNGPASFQYTVEDNGTTNGAPDPKSSGPATVSFSIWEVNDAPTAVGETIVSVTDISGPRTILASTLTANDLKGPANESGQTLIIKTVSNPVGGTVSIVNGNVVFTPTANYNGPQSFDYTVQDNGTTHGLPDPKTSGTATAKLVGPAQSLGTSGIIISEFRFDGPNGAGDEFVELVNNSNAPKTVVSSDANNLKGFSVWGIVDGSARKICTIPFNTLLAPGQHFLCAMNPGFELGGYSQGQDDNIANYTATGLSVDGGLALFSSEDAVVNGDGTFTSTGPVFREDAVGFRKKNSDTNENVFLPVLREGQGLAPIGRPTGPRRSCRWGTPRI